MAYDGGDERGLPAWDEQALDLGAPHVMDVPTFIEWLERQLETPEETEHRMRLRKTRHKLWHDLNPGYISSCCITWGRIQTGSVDLSQIQAETRSVFRSIHNTKF